MTAGDYMGDGKFLSIYPTTTTTAGLVAGDLCTMTGTYIGTSVTGSFADTQVIGVVLVGSLTSTIPGTVCTDGIFELTASASGFTTGKTVIAAGYKTVEDGTTAGKVIGKALQTVTSGNTGDVLIRV